MKLTLSFLSNRFAAWPKSREKTLSILRTKSAFEVKWKAFFIIFKGLSAAKNGLKPESAPLIDDGSEDEKAKDSKNCFIKRKLKFENYKNCLEAIQLKNEISYLENNKINIDSIKKI